MFFGDKIQLKREGNTSRTTTAATKPTSDMNMMTSANKLPAGYMAYEFLTKGTMLGHKFGTDRSETTAFSGNERYEQITSLLIVKTEGGDRISGVVNPTELHRWIEMIFFFVKLGFMMC
ncbi:hypothetical protein Hanom_Chr16g01434691 [Helianthus anomalus]